MNILKHHFKYNKISESEIPKWDNYNIDKNL